MFEVKVIDKVKPIVVLKWIGLVNFSEVEKATEEMLSAYKELGSRKLHLMVDASELKVFKPDTKEAIIEQQKIILPYTKYVASVVHKSIVTKQLNETREKANNDKDIQFSSYEEALHYLQSK